MPPVRFLTSWIRFPPTASLREPKPSVVPGRNAQPPLTSFTWGCSSDSKNQVACADLFPTASRPLEANSRWTWGPSLKIKSAVGATPCGRPLWRSSPGPGAPTRGRPYNPTNEILRWTWSPPAFAKPASAGEGRSLDFDRVDCRDGFQTRPHRCRGTTGGFETRPYSGRWIGRLRLAWGPSLVFWRHPNATASRLRGSA